MRGNFGRQRLDRPHASIAVGSYEAAVFPPRAYQCHTFDVGIGIGQNTVMLPSIDSDSICKPFTKDIQSTNKGQRKPSLRDYFLCFSSPNVLRYSSTFPGLEPINVLHYPELYDSGNPVIGWNHLAKAINFPGELAHTSTTERSSVLGLLSVPDKLRIRSSQRRKPPKPTRRGATVTVSEPKVSSIVPFRRGKRPRTNDDKSNDEDDGKENQVDLDSENDDEASIGMLDDDDDDDAADEMDSGDEDPLL